MPVGFENWDALERECSNFVMDRRGAKNVQTGLIYSSYFFVLELLESMQERYATDVDTTPIFRNLLYDSLLFHHSMLGTMHVQKKTLQAMEQQLCSNAEAALMRVSMR